MPEASISIRRAEGGGADFLAWTILAATRSHLPKGWFDVVVGDSDGELDFIRALTLARERSFRHYSYFLIAETVGQPVAALSVFP